jgi:hypothetical protein
MSIKGFEQLREHLPELNSGAGILRLLSIPAVVFSLVTAFFIIEDRTTPFWLLDGEVVLGTLGFILLSLFFFKK